MADEYQETIILDPNEVAVDRMELDITNWIKGGGIDWGDAEIQAYEAELEFGASSAGYRLPNRQVQIPLSLRDLDDITFGEMRSQLQRKVGLWQREQRGWIARRGGEEGDVVYCDVVSAKLHLSGHWFQAYRSFDPDAVLDVTLLPDYYGEEVLSDPLNGANGYVSATIKQGGVDARIGGDYPARTRIIVTETAGQDHKGLLWAVDSRHYSPAATAREVYEAEELTPLAGASVAALGGASGGNAVQYTNMTRGVWIPILNTNRIASPQPLTHQGTYRVRVRCHSSTGQPRLRLQWGVGSLSVPITNDQVELYGKNNFYVLDLGVIRLDAPPVGTHQWQGVIQAYSQLGGDTISLDVVEFQPVEEGAGRLAYLPSQPPSSIDSGPAVASTLADDSSNGGSVAWYIAGADSWVSSIALGPPYPVTHWLKATDFRFNIPASATIVGILVGFSGQSLLSPYGGQGIWDNAVRLIRGGVIQSADRAAGHWPDNATSWRLYGGSGDTWGGGWTPTNVNASGFGFAVAVALCRWADDPYYQIYPTAWITSVAARVYYTLPSGLAVAEDRVLYANQSTELRSDGMYRLTAASSGSVGHIDGDLPRLPPSGLEGRACRLYLRLSRGDLDQEPDSALEAFTTRVAYRPCYLQRP